MWFTHEAWDRLIRDLNEKRFSNISWPKVISSETFGQEMSKHFTDIQRFLEILTNFQ